MYVKEAHYRIFARQCFAESTRGEGVPEVQFSIRVNGGDYRHNIFLWKQQKDIHLINIQHDI